VTDVAVGADGILRAPIQYGGGNPRWSGLTDGWVACDPTEVLHNEDGYGDEGTLLVSVTLPVHRAEALVQAIELLDETAELWRSSEHVPSGWKDVAGAIMAVTAELERTGRITPEPID
jgi:hypothetical protein